MRSRTPIYYDEEANLINHTEIPLACSECGDVKLKSAMQFSAAQIHQIHGTCSKCWNKEPLGR